MCAYYHFKAELHLFENKLNGTIPTELGLLSNMEQLDLYSNQLTGTIPSELGLLSNLMTFYLGSNQLTGAVPTTLATLPLLSKSQITFAPVRDTVSELWVLSHVRILSSLQST